jgi:hypothetical protein
MIKFIKDVQLAIDLLNIIGDKPMRIADIAPVIGTSKFYLERVVRKLNHKGLLKSAKGRGGGITKIERDISLQQVMLCFYDMPVVDTNSTSGVVNLIFIEVLGVVPVLNGAPEIVKMREIIGNISINPTIKEVKIEESKEVEETEDIDLSSW